MSPIQRKTEPRFLFGKCVDGCGQVGHDTRGSADPHRLDGGRHQVCGDRQPPSGDASNRLHLLISPAARRTPPSPLFHTSFRLNASFEQRHVRSGSGRTGALVMTPRQPTVFGQDRLDAVRRCPGLSAAKEGMLCRIEDRESNTPILILRATDDDGSRLWEFDPDFSAEELAGVARDFVQSLLPFYRRVARSGIVLFVHSGWRSRDLATLREIELRVFGS